MAKFRKKPVVIEAEQWEGPWCEIAGVITRKISGDENSIHGAVVEFGVETLEGFMRVSPGDFIITGIKGEKYPCKPDIFAATYEPA